MAQKYWVPAIERVNGILNLIATQPSKLRLIDISKELEINKSTMYSLLNTLETLGWIVKEKGDTYSLGPSLGGLSAAYFRQFNILQSFYLESEKSIDRISENIQLGILDGGNVVYLAKKEGSSPLRLATYPGMKFPAYASAIGKAQLSKYDLEELKTLYPYELEAKTPYTLDNLDSLWEEMKTIKEKGYASESQEGAMGFYCIAAPVYNHANEIIAGVSFTMLENSWKEKQIAARDEIIDLAQRLSEHAGHIH
ncbi:IclR family transcriptional regulator [Halobacillus salinarum]|uniref:IclR family transcriptional regulator n=1 Tax=Halobacillus salinarum TaxID=2932257 RepID=A0ABY4EQB1_9BACI|nr:IclR family transcriptional regulator [Halobacillus salinarum]UOQ44291.1 IclR family transcriptional regulator [Halobacillus salinarum]